MTVLELPLAGLPVRFSHLKAYGRSPMHGLHARIGENIQTYAMQRGTAVHALCFGNRRVIGYPGAVRRGKEYDAFVAENPDAEILTASEFEKSKRMADAIMSNPLAAPLLAGINETTLKAKWMGMDCRATPDVRGLDYLTELKTSATSEPNKFLWQALRMHYPAQMWFQKIIAELNGYTADRLYIVACESAEPYPVTVFEIQPRACDIAARELVLWMERLKACEQSKQFPPYCQSIVPLDVPEDDVDLIYPVAEDDET